MKVKTTIILFVALALTATTASTKVWWIDNNTANEADYTDLQAAQDGAAVGDTLYVAGSGTKYGSLTLTKTLYIFCPGYFLSKNLDNQAIPLSAKTGSIAFSTDSEGSLISGIYVRSDITISANNVIIRSNLISGNMYFSANVSNCISTQNYISGGISISSNCHNLIFSNNIVSSSTSNTSGISMQSDSSADIQYNVICGGVGIHNSTFFNNIITENNTFSATNCDVRSNISEGTQVGTDNGNQSNVDMSTVFVDAGSTDGKWQLADGSPAKGAGIDDTDIGMFGGTVPYVLSGIPNIPRIYFFTAPSVGTEESGINVHLKAKSSEN